MTQIDAGTAPPLGAPSAPTPDPRRHDLDALRGFAMLLGIILHATLAFFPSFWPVTDGRASLAGPFDEILWIIHGFRMPVFFLLSGYFTAMLWRRRGVARLISHRARRIGLPLLIGVFTIVPLMDATTEWAYTSGIDDDSDLFAAAYFGDVLAAELILDGGFDVNAVNPADPNENTALHLAAVTNEAEVAELLLERGANFNARNADFATPLDVAVYFGHPEAAEAIVAGGHIDYRPPGGDWDEISFWGDGAADSPFHQRVGNGESGEDDIGLSSWVTSFHHLWFLWFLCWYMAAFAVVAPFFDIVTRRRKQSDRPHSKLGSALIWLAVPLTLLPQLAMGDGGQLPVFGPDTSAGLVPVPHVLAYYALFFAFGALIYGRRTPAGELMSDRLGRHWRWALPVTFVVVLPIGLGLTFEDGPWPVAAAFQAAYAWGMSLGLIGLFSVMLGRERRWVRYLSDSSYWLYVAHLPLIIVLQAWARSTDLPRGIEFTAIVAGATVVLLASYAIAVRHTPIGWLLNGRRPLRRRAPAG
ncbi:acyltransferase family protein [Candidatus Poriferisodalis sp.]|uniref:acyltransferase family protein n=1 Tax=Candidatus Poriferisodalis sp. TaxID=3101277 RepID=UPI003B52D962